jgi:hypothetical protein
VEILHSLGTDSVTIFRVLFDGLVLPVSSTLSHQSAPETLEELHILTGLYAGEDFIE